jgi:hypothetical protein
MTAGPQTESRAAELLAAMQTEQSRVIASRAAGGWRPGMAAPVDFTLAACRALVPAFTDLTDRQLRHVLQRLEDQRQVRLMRSGPGGFRWRLTR